VSPELITLNKMIDQAFDHKSWHGTNLKGSIKGITASLNFHGTPFT